MRRFGFHVSVAGGVERAISRAAALGCDALQIFVGNPRSWHALRFSAASLALFRRQRLAAGLTPLVVHLTYLPNLAAANRRLWRKSQQALVREYEAAAALEAEFFVVHPGSASDDRQRGLARVGQALAEALARLPGGPMILLENTAGAGGQLGASAEELAAIADASGRPAALGVCLDTAHAAAAGLEVFTAQGVARTVRAFARAFGRQALRLIHLNDLRAPPGARRDRHEHLGRGALGVAGLRAVLAAPILGHLPAILETPRKNDCDDQRNLAAARQWARASTGSPTAGSDQGEALASPAARHGQGVRCAGQPYRARPAVSPRLPRKAKGARFSR
ncbi:MAG: deoxyribonuclease IV [Planctomycetota bacterium]|nr:deoxyribonuclease IV [Planctomycetota bacterium]